MHERMPSRDGSPRELSGKERIATQIKDMLGNLPTMNTCFMCIPRSWNNHYEAGLN